MQFAVIGNPISHSLSPMLHNFAFIQLGIRGYYGRYLLKDSEHFADVSKLALHGANITIPFKEVAYRHCDEVIGIAQKIGAVNTLVWKNQKVYGHNTDAPGFYECIKDQAFHKALIIGAGGSARAIACVLAKHGLHCHILNRSKERLLGYEGMQTSTFDDFCVGQYDVIINTTPSGLHGVLPLPKSTLIELFLRAQYAFDLVYGQQTPFLSLACECKIANQDGRQMLINQAILAFEIFMESFGIDYDREILVQSMNSII